MVEAAPGFFLPLKAAVEDHVALELHVGDFDRDGLAVGLIDGLEDRRHPAARDHLDQLVLIEVFTNADLAHFLDRLGEKGQRTLTPSPPIWEGCRAGRDSDGLNTAR